MCALNALLHHLERDTESDQPYFACSFLPFFGDFVHFCLHGAEEQTFNLAKAILELLAENLMQFEVVLGIDWSATLNLDARIVAYLVDIVL